MIPDFKTYIDESIWADIHKRSNGIKTRKEDSINQLDGYDLKEYIISNYKPLNNFAITTYLSDVLSVPIVRNNTGNGCIMYNPISHMISLTFSTANVVDGLLEKIKQNFSVGEIARIYVISPKNGGESTNEFFIDVLDFLLDNIQDTSEYQKSLEKIGNKS